MKRPEKLATESRELLEPLRRAPIAISSSGEGDPQRAKHLPHLQAMVRAAPGLRARQRRRRKIQTLAMAAAALLVAGAGATFYFTRTPATRLAAAQGATVVEGRLRLDDAPALVEGNHFFGVAAIETPRDASARLITALGVQVSLSSASRARLHPGEQRQRVDLMRGEVTLDVPRLTDGKTVTVVTPDATVTVHGTRFSVSYDANRARPSTCVRVTEGLVQVDRGTGAVESLRAGQSSGCDDVSQPVRRMELPKARGVEASSKPVRTQPARTAAQNKGRAGDPHSTLAMENHLLLAGLAAERRHDDAVAKAALNELLTRFPNSPLAAEARDALSRIASRH